MAAPMKMFLSETVRNIYQYLGQDGDFDCYCDGDNQSSKQLIFQEPRMSLANQDKGDLCFPIDRRGCDASLRAVLIHPEYRNFSIKFDTEKVQRELPQISGSWVLPIKSCDVTETSLCIVLDRPKSFENVCLAFNVQGKSAINTSSPIKSVFLSKDAALQSKEKAEDLTQLRTILAFESLCNVFSFLGYNIKMENDDKVKTDKNIGKFHVCHKTICSEKEPEDDLVYCGAVVDVSTGSKARATCVKEYFRKKKLAFEVTAQRRGNTNNHENQAQSLAEAEVVSELLGVKLHDKVSINILRNPDEIGVTRGATFLLYNHVRLSCIRRKFEEEVLNGKYQMLPSVEETDFGLLKQNEEWELLLLALQFPSYLLNCINSRGKISLHPLLIGLDKICRVFSGYYRRVRVLTDSRPQLIPVMCARLHLLQCLEYILGAGISILNIEALDYM